MARSKILDCPASPDGALQYLSWALEEIETLGHCRAALHTRIAMDELRGLRSNRLVEDEPSAGGLQQPVRLATSGTRHPPR